MEFLGLSEIEEVWNRDGRGRKQESKNSGKLLIQVIYIIIILCTCVCTCTCLYKLGLLAQVDTVLKEAQEVEKVTDYKLSRNR